MPAKLTGAAAARIREICGSYAEESTPLIMILSDVQREFGFVPLEAQELISECTGIPETLLDIMDGECTLSEWGRIIWDEVQRREYSKKVIEPLSDRIIITAKVKTKIEKLEPVRIKDFNKQIDELSRFIDDGCRKNLHSLDFRQLTADPVPPSTHEFNLWPDMGAWRGFCHWDDSKKLVIDDTNIGLNHRKQ